jgi:Domain of unknown function (DUF6438)
MRSPRLFPWTILAIALLWSPACRRVAPPAENGAAPPKPGDGTTRLPEIYRFLSEPGVGVESMDSIRAQLPYDSIYLRREPCFGTCPMYEATLYRDGRAQYSGERFVEKEGDYRGEVVLHDYGRLSYLMDKLGFMSLPDSFSVPYTDLPGATLAAHRRPEGLKSVHDYGYSGPPELWALMEVFDRIVDRIKWEKTGP